MQLLPLHGQRKGEIMSSGLIALLMAAGATPSGPPSSGTGYFGGGIVTSTYQSTVYTYGFSSGSVGTGTSLSVARTQLMACGTSTIGLFATGLLQAGGRSTTTDIYTYSSNVVSPGTAFSPGKNGPGAGCGNSTVGVFAYGTTTGTPQATSNLYTYAGNTFTTGTSMGTGKNSPAATGNSTLGVWGGGNTGSIVATTTIYTYSGNSVAAGTNLVAAKSGQSAAGTALIGVFGTDGSTSIYTYSNNSVATGTAISAGDFTAAAGNPATGVFTNGSTTAITNVYTYVSNTVVPGTSIAAVQYMVGTSSAPGGGYT
jgi:hypothetical protein